MGGRIYDAGIGRFLQADPIVQAPNNSQSYNRYAYVFNNPMTFTDPSGYSAWTKFRDKILKPALSIIVAVYLPGAQFMSGWSAVAQGAFTGFVSGGIATGSLRGAIVGALTGALFGELHSMATGTEKVIAHGFVGGIGSALNGGKFGHGFFAAGFTQSLGDVFDKATNSTLRMKNAIKAALIGGTASKLTGGKFANGAVTGAFSRLLNDDSAITKDKEGAELSVEAELTLKAIKARVSLIDGTLEGGLDITESMEIILDENGNGSVSQDGVGSVDFKDLDLDSLKLAKSFKALSVTASFDNNGGVQFHGTMHIDKFIRIPFLKAKVSYYTGTYNISDTLTNSSGLVGQATRALTKPRNSLDYCKNKGVEC